MLSNPMQLPALSYSSSRAWCVIEYLALYSNQHYYAAAKNAPFPHKCTMVCDMALIRSIWMIALLLYNKPHGH